MGVTRRKFIFTSAIGSALLGAGLPTSVLGATQKTVKIGILAPLSGATSDWGRPGFYGCQIWGDTINKAGGVTIGGDNYRIEFVPFDNEYKPSKALTGIKKLVDVDEVKFVMTLGGNTWPAIKRFATSKQMLTSSMMPSDLSPDSPYHIAPCETHPIYNVTGAQWMAEQFPGLKRAVICTQNDTNGLPSAATYKAAFGAEGIDVIDQHYFDPDTNDIPSIVSALLAKNPDVFCLGTCFKENVHQIIGQLYQQGFEGKIISCTLDNYQALIKKTSKEFMEGVIFQFPDFDDPALNWDFVNFNKPNEFYQEFIKRHPDSWSAVAWEYAAVMEIWLASAKRAKSVEPMDVLNAMKRNPTAPHIFGAARWWGTELWGNDNALVGNWPVVTIQDGRARIVKFGSVIDWWSDHSKLLIKHMESMNQMWYQLS